MGTCGPNLSGINCGSALLLLTPNTLYTRTLPVVGTEYPSDVYYIDIPPNTSADLNITITGSVNGGYVYRKNTFPFLSTTTGSEGGQQGWICGEDENGGFPQFTVYLRPEDLLEGGRYFVAVANTGAFSTEVYNYTLFASYQVVTTTGASSTSGVITSAASSTAAATGFTSTGTWKHCLLLLINLEQSTRGLR